MGGGVRGWILGIWTPSRYPVELMGYFLRGCEYWSITDVEVETVIREVRQTTTLRRNKAVREFIYLIDF